MRDEHLLRTLRLETLVPYDRKSCLWTVDSQEQENAHARKATKYRVPTSVDKSSACLSHLTRPASDRLRRVINLISRNQNDVPRRIGMKPAPAND